MGGELVILNEIVVVTTLGVLVTAILARFRLPAVAGLILAGALAGPAGFGLVRSSSSIQAISETGVILLLFTIGLEFSIERMRRIFGRVAQGGLLQVASTIAITAVVAGWLGINYRAGVFYGFIISLSSTAIVLKALGERQELDAPHGRFIVGTLILQDLCVVPMVLVIPALVSAGGTSAILSEIGLAMGKAALVVVCVMTLAKIAVPRILSWIDAGRSRETFLLAVIGICAGTAWVTAQAGLSLALGAFLGGMITAGTEFKHRALGDILPLRDFFTSVFFISVGMMFDIRLVIGNPGMTALFLLAFIVGKGTIASLAAGMMKFPPRAAWLAGIGLAQFGEFGFVLLTIGLNAGLVGSGEAGSLLNAGIISMFLTPLVVRLAPHVTAGEMLLTPLSRIMKVKGIEEINGPARAPLSGHVIIIGYGVAGRMAARAMRTAGIRYIVLDMNVDTVRAASANDENIFYADATSPEALNHAGVKASKAVLIVINDPEASRRIADLVRRLAPEAPVLVRTRYYDQRERCIRSGATDVVADEMEGAVEIMVRLMRLFNVPRNVIESEVQLSREQSKQTLRNVTIPRRNYCELPELAEIKVDSVLVRGGSQVVGRSAADLRVRDNTGALIVAMKRDGALKEFADPKKPFRPGDVVYLFGTGDAVKKAVAMLGSD